MEASAGMEGLIVHYEPEECTRCLQWVSCSCDQCHQVCLQPDVMEEVEDGYSIEERMFGNFEQCQEDTEEFLTLGDIGDLYFLVCTPYDKKYTENQSWYRSPLAYRAVERQIKEKNYCMTREYLHCAKAHLNCMVYSKRDLVKILHNKKGYKYHYHVQKVNDPVACRDYIFKDATIYDFENGDDYILQYKIGRMPDSARSAPPRGG